MPKSFKRQRECSFAVVINGRTYAAFIDLKDAVDWAEHRYSRYPVNDRCLIQIIDDLGDEFHKYAWPSSNERSKTLAILQKQHSPIGKTF
jgi:hypothetical protein